MSIVPFSSVFPVIYQRLGKCPKKAAARKYNCVFPELSPARGGIHPVPLYRVVLPDHPLTFL